AVNAAAQVIASAPDRIGVARLDRLLGNVRNGGQIRLDAARRGAGLVLDLFAAAPRGADHERGAEHGGANSPDADLHEALSSTLGAGTAIMPGLRACKRWKTFGSGRVVNSGSSTILSAISRN